MSSFFTTPASLRKRKRDDANLTTSIKRRSTSKTDAKQQTKKSARSRRDESITSSGSDDEAIRKRVNDAEVLSESESEVDDETGAERRLRLAEQYLENIKGEVDEVGFDAEEIDKDLIAERLQEDVVCSCLTAHCPLPDSNRPQGRDQRSTLPAYSLHARLPLRDPNLFPHIILEHNLSSYLCSFRIHRSQRSYPHKVGATHSPPSPVSE